MMMARFVATTLLLMSVVLSHAQLDEGWVFQAPHRLGTQLLVLGDSLISYSIGLDEAEEQLIVADYFLLDGTHVKADSLVVEGVGQLYVGESSMHFTEQDRSCWLVETTSNAALLVQHRWNEGVLDFVELPSSMDSEELLFRTLATDSEGHLLLTGVESEGGMSFFLRLDGETLETIAFTSDLLVDAYVEDLKFLHPWNDGYLLSGTHRTGTDPAEPSPVATLLNPSHEEIWSQDLGNLELHDYRAAAKPANADSAFVAFAKADFLPALSTNPEATSASIYLQVRGWDGALIDEHAYTDSLIMAEVWEVEIANERVYVSGTMWGEQDFYFESFLLVTDLDGELLNYRALSLDSCFYCISRFPDLEVGPDGNLYAAAHLLFESEGLVTPDFYVRQFDCLGNDATPNLTFQPQGVLYPDGTAQVWLQENHFETHHWEVDGATYFTDTLTLSDWGEEELALNILGSYCELELDTSLVLNLPLSIHDLESVIQVYPNPAKDWVIVHTGLHGDAELHVFDTTGRAVHQQFLSAGANRIDCTAWSPGSYLLLVKHPSGYLLRSRISVD